MHRSRKSFIRPCILCSLISAILICGFAPSGASAQIYKGSKMVPGTSRNPTSPSTNAATGKNYFTVLGEVRFPQTYELPTSSPSLVDLLRFCSPGWPVPLTPNASGMIRIIRNGHSAQQVYFAETLTLTLMPGDIVIAEDKFGQGRMLRGNASDTEAANERTHVCLVGVREYPIVRAMPAETATIENVVRDLGQKPEMAARVKAISSKLGPNTQPNQRLPHNTVLLFPTSQIDVARLPSGIPIPYRAGIDQRATQPQREPAPGTNEGAGRAFVPSTPPAPPMSQMPTVIIDETEQPGSVALDPEPQSPSTTRSKSTDPSAEGRARVNRTPAEPKRFTPPPTVAPVDTTPAAPEPAVEAIKPFASSINDDNDSSPITDDRPNSGSSKRKSELPLTPAPETSEEIEPNQPRNDQPVNPGRSLAMQGANSAAERGETSWRSELPPSAIPRPSSGPLPTPVKSLDEDIASRPLAGAGEMTAVPNGIDWISGGMIGLGAIGLAVLTFFGLSNLRLKPRPTDSFVVRHPQPIAPATEPVQPAMARPQATPFLDRLINNEIPIETEVSPFPRDLRVHGRPVENPRSRLDAPHNSIPAPHFKPQRQAATSTVMPATATARESELMDSEPRDSEPIVTAAARREREQPTVTTPEVRRPEFSRVLRVDRSSTPKPHVVQPVPVTETAVVEVAAEKATRTIRPSRVITEGSDIVDRALSAFHQQRSGRIDTRSDQGR